MSINEKIEGSLKNISEHIWPIKCPLEKQPEEYIVYNPELEEAGVFADNRDLEWNHYMQIHLFTKKNYIEKRKKLRNALRENEFMVTDITTLYEKDTGYYHLCFSCWTEETEE